MSAFRDKLGNSYCARLYRADKGLFAGVLLFFGISLAANLLIRLEVTPFFVWNMYSEPSAAPAEYTFYEVRYNDSLVNIPHTWEGPRQMLIFDPLTYYMQVQLDRSGIDPSGNYLEHYWGVKHPAFFRILPALYNGPEQYRDFPSWFRRYLAAQIGEKFDNIKIVRKKLYFEATGRVRARAADTVLVITMRSGPGLSYKKDTK